MSGVPLPNEKDLRRRYGLSPAQYVELLEAQGGVCAICGKPPKGRPLVPDHDHDTLTIDGLVCLIPCNRMLRQTVRRYLANPPGRQFGWTVPAELEAKTIARREGNKARAKAKRAAAAQVEPEPEPYLGRLQDMTRPTAAAIEALEDDYAAQTERALAATAAPAWGWTEPPPVAPKPERRPRRLRLRFRSGG